MSNELVLWYIFNVFNTHMNPVFLINYSSKLIRWVNKVAMYGGVVGSP